MPGVSVIMTSYNHEAYLNEAISSILTQTINDFELIVIDDASLDNSVSIIMEAAKNDSRIRAFFHEENLGISRTLNEALSLSKGDYIAIAASDDLWIPEKLEKQLDILKTNNNLIVWSDAYIINAKSEYEGLLWSKRYKLENKQKSGDLFDQILWGNYICPQSLIMKKVIMQKIGFDNRLRFAIDYRFLVNLSIEHEFYYISEPLVKYRMHGENTIFKNRDLWEKDKFKIFTEVLKQNKKDMTKLLKARLRSRIGRYLLSRKKYKHARHQFLIALKYAPFNFKDLKRFLKSCAFCYIK